MQHYNSFWFPVFYTEILNEMLFLNRKSSICKNSVYEAAAIPGSQCVTFRLAINCLMPVINVRYKVSKNEQ